MSTERDELHRIIDDRVDMLGSGVRDHEVWDAADAILAAGYRKPRVVTTAEELDALPPLTVIRVDDFEVYEKQADGEGGYFWNGVGSLEYYDSEDVLEGGPATVLYEDTK